jgi:hypothetical protein
VIKAKLGILPAENEDEHEVMTNLKILPVDADDKYGIPSILPAQPVK